MKSLPTLPDVKLARPRRFGDARGWFSETYSAAAWAQSDARWTTPFVQDNHSFTAQAGTLRGLHFQAPPHAQAKLVRVARGRVFDVAVDIRQGSPTYGTWDGHELTAEHGEQLLIPAGFAHGFVTLTPDCEVLYKCTDTYAPAAEGGLAWNDPDLGIDWRIDPSEVTLNDRDAQWPRLADLDSPFKHGGAA
jgi:dTDP-4-dehydrorhamnose 3,5-epimerase